MRGRNISAISAIAAAGGIAAVALALSGTQSNLYSMLVLHEEERSFSTAADAPRGNHAFALPYWIPADARNITVRIKTNDPLESLYHFRLGSEELDPDHRCGADRGRLKRRPPSLKADWWPSDAEQSAKFYCDGTFEYLVKVKGDDVYGWVSGISRPYLG